MASSTGHSDPKAITASTWAARAPKGKTDEPLQHVNGAIPLANDIPADPPLQTPSIDYVDHHASLPQVLGFFPGLKAEDLPDGAGRAVERVAISTHNGTHLDAPWRYHPTMNRGERSMTIDEVPLDRCLQPGVKLDFRRFPDGYVASAADVEAELARIGHKLPNPDGSHPQRRTSSPRCSG